MNVKTNSRKLGYLMPLEQHTKSRKSFACSVECIVSACNDLEPTNTPNHAMISARALSYIHRRRQDPGRAGRRPPFFPPVVCVWADVLLSQEQSEMREISDPSSQPNKPHQRIAEIARPSAGLDWFMEVQTAQHNASIGASRCGPSPKDSARIARMN